MPITINWDDAAQTCIRINSSGKYTWNEYREVMDKVFALVAANAQVRAVVMVREPDTQLPAGNPLKHLEATVIHLRQYSPVVIINVNPNDAWQLLLNALCRIYNGLEGRLFAVQTLQEAHGVLRTLHTIQRTQDAQDTSF